MGSNSRNTYELKSGANKLEEINIAFELVEEALATVSAGSGQDIYLYSELSKNYAVMPFNENVYDPVHDVITTDFSSYHWSVISQTYASDAAAQYALAEAEAIKAVAGGTKAELEAWEAEAEKKTADSYATQPYNEVVIIYTSNGDGFFTETPTTEYSAFHHAEASQYFADLALSNSEAVNITAGMITPWPSDRKPAGYLWCDGESYAVFSPTPALAYDELYQVLDDPTYVMTLKPEDWDGLYPLNPNGWYNPNDTDYQSYHDQSALPDNAELNLTVTVPDYRGMFLRAKDRAGSTGSARGIDTHGIVDFNTITWSQNKAHTHVLSTSYLGFRTGNGPTDDDGSAGPDNMTTVTLSEEGGEEGHGTYQTINYIIRTKGVYNGDGSGSGGSGVTPIASEIDYADTHGSGYSNLQDTTDEYFDKRSLIRVKGGTRTPERTAEFEVTGLAQYAMNISGMVQNLDGKYLMDLATMTSLAGTQAGDLIKVFDEDGNVVYSKAISSFLSRPSGGINRNGIIAITTEAGAGLTQFQMYDIATNQLVATSPSLGTSTEDPDDGVGTALVGFKNDCHLYSTKRGATTYQDAVYVIRNDGTSLNLSRARSGWTLGVNPLFGDSDSNRLLMFTADGLSLQIMNGDTGAEITTKSITFDSGITTLINKWIKPAGEDDTYVYVTNREDSAMLRIPKSEIIDDIGTTLHVEKAYDIESSYAVINNNITIYDNILSDVSPRVVYKTDYSTAEPKVRFEIEEYADNNVSDYTVNMNATKDKITYKGIVGDVESVYVAGIDLYATHNYTTLFGYGLKTNAEGQSVYGRWNGASTEDVVIGCGADEANRLDGLTISPLGDVQAPNRPTAPTDKSLVTADNYGVSTIGGTAKFRLDGTVLHIRTDGTDA